MGEMCWVLAWAELSQWLVTGLPGIIKAVVPDIETVTALSTVRH